MATFGKEILSGPLEKKAKHFPFSWQKRHFLLDERSLTYYSGAEVHTYQLRDFQDVLRKGKGDSFDVALGRILSYLIAPHYVFITAVSVFTAAVHAPAERWRCPPHSFATYLEFTRL